MKCPKTYSSLVNKLPINKKKKFWLLRYWKGILGGLLSGVVLVLLSNISPSGSAPVLLISIIIGFLVEFGIKKFITWKHKKTALFSLGTYILFMVVPFTKGILISIANILPRFLVGSIGWAVIDLTSYFYLYLLFPVLSIIIGIFIQSKLKRKLK